MPWHWIGDGSLWHVTGDMLDGVVVVGVTVGKIGTVMFVALEKLMQHPALWGYVSVSVGLVWLWVQLFRWTELARQPVVSYR